MAALLVCILPSVASTGPDATPPVRVAVVAAGHCESAASAIRQRSLSPPGLNYDVFRQIRVKDFIPTYHFFAMFHEDF